MIEKYSPEFAGEAVMAFAASFRSPENNAKLELRKEGEFGQFPLRDGVRLSGMIQSDPLGDETTALRDRIARFCLRGLVVSCWQDDVEMGRLATITDPVHQDLEVDQFLQANPIFYQLVLDVTTAYVLKNFTAPPRSTPGTEAQAPRG